MLGLWCSMPVNARIVMQYMKEYFDRGEYTDKC